MFFSWTTLSQEEEALRRYKVCGAKKTETEFFFRKITRSRNPTSLDSGDRSICSNVRAIEPFGVDQIATTLDAREPRLLAAAELGPGRYFLGSHGRDAGATAIADPECCYGRRQSQAAAAAAADCRSLDEKRATADDDQRCAACHRH